MPPCACFKKFLREWRSEQEKKKEEFVKFIAKILENEEKMEKLEKENEAMKRNEEFAKVVFLKFNLKLTFDFCRTVGSRARQRTGFF